MEGMDELLGSMTIELKRGVLTLAVLSCAKSPQYGYSLLQTLTDSNLVVEAGTLYPLLRRLEKQGLLSAQWSTDESRPRKYYLLTESGVEVYNKLLDEWRTLNLNIENLMEESQNGDN